MSETRSLRAKVYELLDKNPLLSARLLARLLGIPYEKYARYLWKLRSSWKHSPRKEQGSIPSIHAWRGWTYVPLGLHPGVGWRRTRAKNRWWLWKDVDGRLQWFETGRVNIYCRTPASKAKVVRLFVHAFSFSGVIEDLAVVDVAVKGIKLKGAHYVYPTSARLPPMTIDLFSGSNGVVIKVGDRSHPNSIEVLAHYPDWAERNERLLSEFLDLLRGGASKNGDGKGGKPFYLA